MEVLSQPEPEIKAEPTIDNKESSSDTPIMKHIQILSHLDMKDKIFDDAIMEKVAFISDFMEMPEIEELSLKLGNDDWAMSKLDKMYTHIKLKDQFIKGEKRQEILKNQIEQNE